jgi:hypothetical protein
MLNFILQRAKAVVAALVPALTATTLTVIEQQTGIEIPADVKIAIIGVATGIVVHQVPNKAS